ncbi:hypothetical protein C2S51_032620, partial [Perilla frutescens var. frutescens]
MASVQCEKPSKKNQPTNTNEHSLSDKVKDMAQSARKLFHHQEQHAPDHMQKPTSNCPSGAARGGVKTETAKKKKKNTEGHEGHCMPKMLDHVKNLKKKKNKEEKHSDSSSDSDNEITKTK